LAGNMMCNPPFHNGGYAPIQPAPPVRFSSTLRSPQGYDSRPV